MARPNQRGPDPGGGTRPAGGHGRLFAPAHISLCRRPGKPAGQFSSGAARRPVADHSIARAGAWRPGEGGARRILSGRWAAGVGHGAAGGRIHLDGRVAAGGQAHTESIGRAACQRGRRTLGHGGHAPAHRHRLHARGLHWPRNALRRNCLLCQRRQPQCHPIAKRHPRAGAGAAGGRRGGVHRPGRRAAVARPWLD